MLCSFSFPDFLSLLPAWFSPRSTPLINQLYSIHISSSASREMGLSLSDLDLCLVLKSFLHVCLAPDLCHPFAPSLYSDYGHQAQCDSEREKVYSVGDRTGIPSGLPFGFGPLVEGATSQESRLGCSFSSEPSASTTGSSLVTYVTLYYNLLSSCLLPGETVSSIEQG